MVGHTAIIETRQAPLVGPSIASIHFGKHWRSPSSFHFLYPHVRSQSNSIIIFTTPFRPFPRRALARPPKLTTPDTTRNVKPRVQRKSAAENRKNPKSSVAYRVKFVEKQSSSHQPSFSDLGLVSSSSSRNKKKSGRERGLAVNSSSSYRVVCRVGIGVFFVFV